MRDAGVLQGAALDHDHRLRDRDRHDRDRDGRDRDGRGRPDPRWGQH